MAEQEALTSRKKRVLASTIDTADQDDAWTPTKRKSSADDGDASRQSINKPPRKRVRKTNLSGFADLPLDILHEILSKCHPYILLLLARTTKAFRGFLMSKSSKPIWEASLRTVVPALPPCPPSVSEPEYANLMFDRHCHACFATTMLKVDFALRLRYCQRCGWKCNPHSKDEDEDTRRLRRIYAHAVKGNKPWYQLVPKSRMQQFANSTLSELYERDLHAYACTQWVCKARKAASAKTRA